MLRDFVGKEVTKPQRSHWLSKRTFIGMATAACVLAWCDVALCQEVQKFWPAYPTPSGTGPHGIDRGPGFYFAWYKILLCIIPYLFWVKTTDWLNQDLQINVDKTKMQIDVWNPIAVFTFLLGFIALLLMPFFFIGYPIYMFCVLVPLFAYVFQRNSHFEKKEKVFTMNHLMRKMRGEKVQADALAVTLEQDMGPTVNFKAGGKDKVDQQANLIRARQNPYFIRMKEVFDEAVRSNAEVYRMDFVAEGVGIRQKVDGMWHTLEPMDRTSGDGILFGIKQLAALDPNDRRSTQKAEIAVSIPDHNRTCLITTQGTQTGETALLEFREKKKGNWTLDEVGMFKDMQDELKKHLNSPGYVLVSALPNEGLSTFWESSLAALDRVTRDFVGICEPSYSVRGVENIEFNDVDPQNEEAALELLNNLRLKQPEAYVFPRAFSGKVVDELCDEIQSEDKFAISSLKAKSAADALYRFLACKCDRSKFAKSVTAVVFQRLVRRLCPDCKIEYQAPPQLVQKLGLDATMPVYLFKQYELPPPEQRFDEKGKPIEYPTCPTCRGLGYKGRIGLFEIIIVNDLIRKTLVNQPAAESLAIAAKKSGQKTLTQEGIKLVVAGHTSLPELQRVLKQS